MPQQPYLLMRLTPFAAAEAPQKNMKPAGELKLSFWCRWMVITFLYIQCRSLPELLRILNKIITYVLCIIYF